MAKDPTLPDLGQTEFSVTAHEDQKNHPHWDREGVHDIYRTWRTIADSYPDPRVFVAEAHVRPGRLPHTTNPLLTSAPLNKDGTLPPDTTALLQLD